MSNPKMRTLLLCSFLFVTSLVIAKAGLTWTRGNDEAEDKVAAQTESSEHVAHFDHMKHLDKLKDNEARIRVHAERLAERIAGIEVAIESSDFDFDHNFEHNGDGELMIRKEFKVSEGGELTVNVPGADVEVVSTSSDRVEVLVFLDAQDMDKARNYFEDLEFEVGSSGNKVYVKARSADKDRWGWNRHGHAQILVRASIPRVFDADVSTSGGDISVEQLEGVLNVATSGGDIQLGSIEGREMNVTTSGGDIDAGRLAGGVVKLTTSGGDIELGAVTGPEIVVRTSGGDIDAGKLDGDQVDVRTSGGDIALGGVTGRSIVKTSGGDIEIGAMDGELDASTSGGDIEVRMLRSASLSLSTTGGSIEILGPSDLAANVDLRASEVVVEGSVKIQGTVKKDKVDGQLNGGGPTISAVSSGGEVLLALNQ
ncbi:MAG TPA: DUF4097 family beta strand repeat-containing protein [Rhodothermales bacterium]|nr:DUF4097 family beta strand repeat-containing protein [Rhodothermales bacterium]